ncbi:putative mitochondrial thiamine pyrophosphate carrier [Apostichopus japonicus]|uniref:Putative mitochondrial thiamine pyrophosphate carrier n=1 Tax=Stichopus japonicus TaxID=307972 RepID=A0A2G8KUE4_STIJA|nr:putative mitochondrial thiamine pyrophosphate carrier [Apostichopus japonicus]
MVGYDSNVSHNFTTTDYQLAGASSGFFTRLLLQPLDVLKIRFQLQSEPISKASPFSKYHGIRQAVSCIYREEGLFGFWKGHNPAQALSVIYGVVQFGCFEHLTASLYPHVPSRFTSGPLKPIYHFGCGGIAGCAAALVAHPFDVLRTRFVSQGEPKIYRSIYHAVQSMYKEAGVRTFYRGLIPALVQVYPHTSFQFAFYTLFNKMWESYFMSHSNSKGTVQSLTCGSLAGIAAKPSFIL